MPGVEPGKPPAPGGLPVPGGTAPGGLPAPGVGAPGGVGIGIVPPRNNAPDDPKVAESKKQQVDDLKKKMIGKWETFLLPANAGLGGAANLNDNTLRVEFSEKGTFTITQTLKGRAPQVLLTGQWKVHLESFDNLPKFGDAPVLKALHISLQSRGREVDRVYVSGIDMGKGKTLDEKSLEIGLARTEDDDGSAGGTPGRVRLPLPPDRVFDRK